MNILAFVTSVMWCIQSRMDSYTLRLYFKVGVINADVNMYFVLEL
jgi:hypothetical protein